MKIKKNCVKIKYNTKGEGIKMEENTRKGVYRVVYDSINKKWNSKRDGAERIIDSRKTKEEALERARVLSENQNLKFVVYKKDGKFQKKR